MKKFIKFVLAVAAAAGIVIAALYAMKKYFGFGEEEDFLEDEDFEDVFADEVDDREYVTLDIEDEEPATTE